MRIHCILNEKEREKERVVNMRMELHQTLIDVLKYVAKERGEVLKESIYNFQVYNPLRKRTSDKDVLEYRTFNNAKTIDINTPIKNLITTELLVLAQMFTTVAHRETLL